MENYLVDNYDVSSFQFTKPKKYGEHMISKLKKNGDDLFIQFPKMLVVSEDNSKKVELEFTSERGYSKKVYNFLAKLDDYIVEYIINNCEEWFGKKIPIVSEMYNKFIKAPKTSENKCTIHFNVKGEITYKGELEDIVKGQLLECISQIKYIVFSKDTCFVTWEICNAKIHKKILRVPKFGFIEDVEDNEENEENETKEDLNYFF
jgi:hypothetical protein